MVESLPSNAEDLGSIPGGGTQIPYPTPQLLTLSALEPVLQRKILQDTIKISSTTTKT